MARKRFDAAELDRLRALPLVVALERVGMFAKVDPTYVPKESLGTQRWFVSGDSVTFELLVTRAKWFDVRQGRGGGGAIDLVAHVAGVDFAKAVKLMLAAGL